MKKSQMSIYTRIGLLISAITMMLKNLISHFPEWLAIPLLVLSIGFLTYGLFYQCRKVRQVDSRGI